MLTNKLFGTVIRQKCGTCSMQQISDLVQWTIDHEFLCVAVSSVTTICSEASTEWVNDWVSRFIPRLHDRANIEQTSRKRQADVEQTSSWLVQLTRANSSSQFDRVNGVWRPAWHNDKLLLRWSLRQSTARTLTRRLTANKTN